ncbi:hypothetical protein D3C77_641530 [compost metagenome]
MRGSVEFACDRMFPGTVLGHFRVVGRRRNDYSRAMIWQSMAYLAGAGGSDDLSLRVVDAQVKVVLARDSRTLRGSQTISEAFSLNTQNPQVRSLSL